MMRRAAISLAMLCMASAASVGRAASPVQSYTADPPASRLDFIGIQAGAEFKGTFRKFTAAIDFSPDALASSHFDVQIDLNSLDTMDDDRDTTMRGPDIFDIAHFPASHYVTRSFTKTPAGYSAAGTLSLHGVTKEVPIDFVFVSTPGGAKLEGTAKLNRLEFGVGQGDWKSTESVKDVVKVAFSLILKPKA
ncbi:MAG: YceI family protein [Steroidobacteraceae bacterium]